MGRNARRARKEVPLPPDDPVKPALALGGRPAWQWDGLAVLVLLVLALPWLMAIRVPFIWFDDPTYIAENPDISHGLSVQGIGAAFISTRGSMWIPLTWVSYMLDVSLFGMEPWGFHLTNVVLHAANGLLVFAFLRIATGEAGRLRALVAALVWMIHPLRVESVAWATERKDVLSLFFALLAMLAYLRYTRAATKAIGWYCAAGILFLCSLMAKPMTVTLPCVLLLLDFWPLNRWSRAQAPRLILEKLPLLAMALGISAATLAIPASHNVLVTGDLRSVGDRLANAATGLTLSLRDNFYLEQLSFFYPLRDVSPVAAFMAVVLLAGTTAAAIWLWRKRPVVGRPALVGWLWFVGALVPTSGIFQIGMQSRADRFTYFPAIGLIMAVVWIWPGEWFRVRIVKLGAGLLTGGIVVALTLATVSQIALWQDPFGLYYYSALRTSPNWWMEFMVGKLIQDEAKDAAEEQEAARRYVKSIEAQPKFALSHYNLATILVKWGQLEAAVAEFRVALSLNPNNPQMAESLAWAEAELAKQKAAAATATRPAATGPR